MLLEEFDGDAWEANKKVFKEIANYLDDTNMSQLMNIFAKWIDE
jgi:hypothetical protein